MRNQFIRILLFIMICAGAIALSSNKPNDMIFIMLSGIIIAITNSHKEY